jgi:hypothetical protein
MRRPLVALALATLALAAPAARADSLGLNVHQSSTTGLDATRDATLHWVRIDLNWLDVEPTEGAFDFSRIDPVVDGAKTRGLEVLAVLAYTPAWASSGDTKGGGPNNDVPLAGKYEAFVKAAVTHYAGKVTHFEIWNEPNLGAFFEGTTADYTTRILVPGADAVHAACPACKVVAPGLASIANAYDTWLDASLTAAAAKIDIASGHAYASFPEDDSQAGLTKDSFYNKLDQHRKIMVGGTVVYEGPLSFKEVLDKHAFTKPFWLTETGREAAYGDTANEASQTLLYRRVMEAMIARPWWETTIFYEAFDEPSSGYTFGVVMHDDTAPGGYKAKPVMDLLKKAGPGVHFGGTVPECSDGLDDDRDGLVDYPADPDCLSATGPSVSAPNRRSTETLDSRVRRCEYVGHPRTTAANGPRVVTSRVEPDAMSRRSGKSS